MMGGSLRMAMNSACFVPLVGAGGRKRADFRHGCRSDECGIGRVRFARSMRVKAVSFTDPLPEDVNDEEIESIVEDLRQASESEVIEKEFAYSLMSRLRMGNPNSDKLSIEVFHELQRRKILTNFGAFENKESSPQQKGVAVAQFAERTGIPLSALLPKQITQNEWVFAAVIVAIGIFYIDASNHDMEFFAELVSVIGIGAYTVDQVLLRGSLFESVYRFFYPERREKVVRHEAGHLLMAYLLGCPVRGYVIDAYEALLKDIPGQSGTVFSDPKLKAELATNNPTQRSIDRYSTVVMGGIAAEALSYGRAEGGQRDEKILVSLLSGLEPAWHAENILNQARWSAQTAFVLISYQGAAYEALVDSMREGAPLGDCIRVIEDNLIPLQAPLEPHNTAAVATSTKQLTDLTAEENAERAKARLGTPTKWRTELSAEEKAERSKAQLEKISKREKEISDRLKEIDSLLEDKP